MIHRVIFGSIERFIGILTEHFAGKYPLWLAHVQIKLLTVTEKFAPFAQELADKCAAAGLRAETDVRNEKIGYKIREARNERTPYIVTIGEKELESGLLSVVPARKVIWDRFRRMNSSKYSKKKSKRKNAERSG